MARFYQAEIGQEEGDQPKKKNKQGTSSNTPGDEAEFVHSLTPKQKAEYNSLDENQKAIVKYVFGVPSVDVSKIDLSGNKQKESTAVSAPPLPTRREDAHSGSGRSFGMDAGIGTQVRTGSDGVKKRRLEADFRNAAPGSEDWGTGFTHRSGSFSADASGSGTKPNTNQAVFTNRASSMPRQEKEETIWQRILNSFLGGLKNSAAGFTDAARTLYEVGQGGRTRDLQDLRDSTARQLETAERQRDYLLEHPEAGVAEQLNSSWMI